MQRNIQEDDQEAIWVLAVADAKAIFSIPHWRGFFSGTHYGRLHASKEAEIAHKEAVQGL